MVHSSRRSSSGAHPATYASLRCLRASLVWNMNSGECCIGDVYSFLLCLSPWLHTFIPYGQLLRVLFAGQNKVQLLSFFSFFLFIYLYRYKYFFFFFLFIYLFIQVQISLAYTWLKYRACGVPLEGLDGVGLEYRDTQHGTEYQQDIVVGSYSTPST